LSFVTRDRIEPLIPAITRECLKMAHKNGLGKDCVQDFWLKVTLGFLPDSEFQEMKAKDKELVRFLINDLEPKIRLTANLCKRFKSHMIDEIRKLGRKKRSTTDSASRLTDNLVLIDNEFSDSDLTDLLQIYHKLDNDDKLVFLVEYFKSIQIRKKWEANVGGDISYLKMTEYFGVEFQNYSEVEIFLGSPSYRNYCKMRDELFERIKSLNIDLDTRNTQLFKCNSECQAISESV